MFLIDREHPPRHIHIKYGEHEAVMVGDTLFMPDIAIFQYATDFGFAHRIIEHPYCLLFILDFPTLAGQGNVIRNGAGAGSV